MFVNNAPRYEVLSEDAMDVLDRGWRRIVSEIGVEFASPWATEMLAAAGQSVDGIRVRFDPDWVMAQVAVVDHSVRVRPPRAQPGAQRRHRRRQHGLRRRLRPALLPPRRRAHGGHPRGLPQLREALPGLPRARLRRRRDHRAERRAAGLAAPAVRN